MAALPLADHQGEELTLDLCHACHGLWLDQSESQRLAPAGVIELFRTLHAHRGEPAQPLAHELRCPRCRRALQQGVDLVRSGRFITHRCPQRHGRFSTFSSFMIEKGFVRLLTKPEIADLAERVRVIHCTGCGAPVDLRQHDSCPYCKSAFSLLDPSAVERALAGYGQQAQRQAEGARPADLADALVSLERDRERARREAQRSRLSGGEPDPLGVDVTDLWITGVELVWKVLTSD